MNTEELRSSEKIVNYFLDNIKDLGKLSAWEGRDVLQLASFTSLYCQNILLKNKCLDLLYYCCFNLKEIELKELWNIYWILTGTLFRECDAAISGNLDELYRMIFKKVEEAVTDEFVRTDNSGSNVIVITTNQFLGIEHAPTRRVLDYSFAIATSLQKQVVIINEADYYYYPCDCLVQDRVPFYDENLNRIKEVIYRGLSIPFIQVPGRMPDLYSIKEMLRKIYLLQPELVYNIGGSCLVSDLCKTFTKTACLPCSTDIPVSMSEFLLVGRSLDDKDAEHIKRLEPYQKVIETIINYELSENTVKYERKEFGIQESDYVIAVVGNRLDEEISDEFVSLIEKTINQFDVHYMVVGKIDNRDRIKKRITKNENLHFTGDLREAHSAVKLCDIYCNPKRSGGGRSSFEALAYGVPVLTLKYGDVYYTCGSEFALNTYNDFLERINMYISDREYYKNAREKALNRAKVLSDISGTQKGILEKILL